MCTTVVVLEEDNVRSFSATPYGQSNDPRSKHHADQAERLFSRGRLKPTGFGTRPSDTAESSRTLSYP